MEQVGNTMPELYSLTSAATARRSVVLKKNFFMGRVHCNENPIYVFPEKELRGLSPNFRINVSVSDLYIPRISPHIFLQQNRQINHGKI